MKKTLVLLAVIASLALSGCETVNSYGGVDYDTKSGNTTAFVGWGSRPPVALPLPKQGYSKL